MLECTVIVVQGKRKWKWPLGLRDFYHNDLIRNDCI